MLSERQAAMPIAQSAPTSSSLPSEVADEPGRATAADSPLFAPREAAKSLDTELQQERMLLNELPPVPSRAHTTGRAPLEREFAYETAAAADAASVSVAEEGEEPPPPPPELQDEADTAHTTPRASAASAGPGAPPAIAAASAAASARPKRPKAV